MISQIPNEELVESLRNILEAFSSETIPEALNILGSLSKLFLELSQDELSDPQTAIEFVEVAMGSKGSPAESVLRCILVILEELSEETQLISQSNSVLNPVLEVAFGENAYDFFPDACRILGFLTYFGEKVCAEHWHLYTKIVRLLDVSGLDSLDHSINVIDNLISRDNDFFLAQTISGVNIFNTTMGIWAKVTFYLFLLVFKTFLLFRRRL